MTNEERISAVQQLGYNERQASFLVLAALHGGYFLRRQFAAFCGHEPGGSAECLIEKALRKGHVQAHATVNRTIVYHVATRPFFNLIGEEDNRNRHWRQPFTVRLKLLGFDYVLAHREHRYLATETEKLDYFAGTLGIDRTYLPARVYHSKSGTKQATRYFVDKFPLFLSGAPGAPQPVVSFCYVDQCNAVGLSGFRTHLAQYDNLFSRLGAFQVIYVAPRSGLFSKAERIFTHCCAPLYGVDGRPADPLMHRVLEHFRDRDLFEKRQTMSFDKNRLDRLRDELDEFRGPEYEAKYRRWREQGDAALTGPAGGRKPTVASFRTYRLARDFHVFEESPERLAA